MLLASGHAEASAAKRLRSNRLRGHVPQADLTNKVMDQNETSGQLSGPASDVGRHFHCRHIAAQRLGPVQQLVMSRVRRIAKLGVLAGGTLSADRLEINRRKDGVLGLGTPGGSFLEQRYRGLTAARAMKDVNIQVRHDSSPVGEASICSPEKKPAATIAIAHD